jgi:hypothetical protein
MIRCTDSAFRSNVNLLVDIEEEDDELEEDAGEFVSNVTTSQQ